MMPRFLDWFASAQERATREAAISSLASAHLDAIRGAAAIAVFLGHWRSFWWPHYDPSNMSLLGRIGYFLTGFPHEAVIVFFVLSGFLVGGSAIRSLGRWNWQNYIITRLSRLWTVLIPALVVGGALDLWGGHSFSSQFYVGQSVPIYWDVAARLNAPTLACNIFFLQTIICQPLGSNGVLWSLANEFWYYIIFPMIILAMYGHVARRVRLTYAFFALLGLIFVGAEIAQFFIIWLLGAAITIIPKLSLEKTRELSSLVALSVIVLVCAVYSRVTKDFLADFALGFTCAALVWVLASSKRQAGVLYARVAAFISALSYTLYLVHLPVLVFVSSYLMKTNLSVMQMAWSSCIFVAAFAVLFYLAFERQTPLVRKLVTRMMSRIDRRSSPVRT